MRHADPEELRRLVDEPAAVPDERRAHVASCDACLDALAAVRAPVSGTRGAGPAIRASAAGSPTVTSDATRPPAAGSPTVASDATQPPAAGFPTPTAPATAAHPSDAGPVIRTPDAAASRPIGPATSTAARPHRTARRRPAALLRRPAFAVVAVAGVLAGAGTAAANGWVPMFRTEQVAPLSVTPEDLVALPDLSAYGDLEVTEPDVRDATDASAAADRTGLAVPTVTDLPRGVQGEPDHRTVGEVRATFTFSADHAARATRAATDDDVTLPPPPPGLDGSRVELVAGPGWAQVWADDGTPTLVVARAVAPTASSDGVALEVARDYLLSLPGLPDDVAAQLRTFAADGSTLPIPVPADEVVTSATDVDGAPATLLESRDRTVAAVVWVDDGVVTVVGGPLDADEVLAVARDLG
ncbi:hypothetical protein [Cellulomonas carbonis]|uniref:DUF4367 domain-containing protein n=1 Tax=Cellulomonas carbonis T26 TaxID=947969 RepID=A0A0A0BMB0_9CELL|nr:hypothetical protein [Cellulomonas carbonis]KGM09643.1 hypothetical protein N868_01105 [Cellulomonas carbonis T26]GGC07073.1 hypothetical protein GCM10010972_20450 [Cellulomonas carbonis]